jgi:hypothetical protein
MTKSVAKPSPPATRADASSYDVDPGKGWVLFAGVMLGVVGVLNLIAGIAAVDNSQFYIRDVDFVLADLRTFGWALIVVGALQLLASFGVFRQSEAARWAGIAFAGANMVLQFFFLPAHPVASVMIFFVDVIIIFGLLTYGGRDRYSLRG